MYFKQPTPLNMSYDLHELTKTFYAPSKEYNNFGPIKLRFRSDLPIFEPTWI